VSDHQATRPVPAEPAISVPATIDTALDPRWLSEALASIGHGSKVTSVERVEVIRTVATKVRFAVTFDGLPGTHAFCLKGLLDVDQMTARGGPTCVLEADFYTKVAGTVGVRLPECVAAITDRKSQQAVIVMRDLIAGGARFCSALEAFTADEAADSLGQIARLHAGSDFLNAAPWIQARVADLARMTYVTPEVLQEMLNGPRGEGLSAPVLNAARLIEGMRALAAKDAGRPQFLVHGDSHAGNIFRTREGAGLIDWQMLQRGGWALDVAYHLCAVLPVDVAERDERRLLGHYLEMMRGFGRTVPGQDEAWLQYREAVLYGYYLWAITRRVAPPIINLFVNRLGSAVTRHGSHALLGVA
jgi:hypothetical protein